MKFQVCCCHESLRQPILDKFKELGARNSNSEIFQSKNYNYYQLWDDKGITHSTEIHNPKEFPLITLDDFFSKKPIHTFQLNEAYTVVFEKDSINVGCQSFDKQIMLDFARAIIDTYTPEIKYTS